MTQATLQNSNAAEAVLYMAMDLGGKSWKLALGDGRRNRYRTIDAGCMKQLLEEIRLAKEKLGIELDAGVLSCHEAGRDGFSVHRMLIEAQIDSLVIDSASIEVNRRARRAKTDRLDAKRMVRQLVRYHGGETDVFAVARVPTIKQEDARRLGRERERLQKECMQHKSRIKALLATQHIKDLKNVKVETIEQQEVPPLLKAELVREAQRFELVNKQLSELDKQRRERLRDVQKQQQQTVQGKQDVVAEKTLDLALLRGVGTVGAWMLVSEFFSWRTFANRRQVAGAAGLCPTPWISEDGRKEQGISKAGNGRVRRVMNQLAWLWLRHQPGSALTQWFNDRWGPSGKRSRKVGITALSRRLLIALWLYLERGVVPEGALLKPSVVVA